MDSSQTGAADLAVCTSLSTTDSPGGGAVSSVALLLVVPLPLLGAGAGVLVLPMLVVGGVVGVVAVAVLVAGVSTTALADPIT
jgi:hypothetical protein